MNDETLFVEHSDSDGSARFQETKTKIKCPPGTPQPIIETQTIKSITLFAGHGCNHLPLASEKHRGIVELATPKETLAGKDRRRAVHPAGLKSTLETVLEPYQTGEALPVASEDIRGIVQLATAAETLDGTNNTNAVHPAGLTAALNGRIATTARTGLVSVGQGLAVNAAGRLDVDFSQASGQFLEEIMKAIRVPSWLTADTTWYVRTTGNDANDGTTADKAFRTVQAALNHIATNFNLGPYQATVNVGEGTFAAFTLPKYTAGTGSIVISGTGIDRTIISGTNQQTVHVVEAAGTFRIDDMTLSLTANSALGNDASEYAALYVDQGSTVHLRGCKLTVNEEVQITNAVVAAAFVRGGRLYCSSGAAAMSMALNGFASAPSCVGFLVRNSGSVTMFQSITVSGRVSTFFDGMMFTSFESGGTGPTFTGTVTGQRFNLSSFSLARVGGDRNFFPGSTAGNVGTGCLFD